MSASCREFEFDPAKSAANAAKHGLDFSQAQLLWDDADLLTVPSGFPHEPRTLAIGSLEGRVWTAVFVLRGERIRLISVRRARDHEKEKYQIHRYDC